MTGNRHQIPQSLESLAQDAAIKYGFTPFFDRDVQRQVRSLKPLSISRKVPIKDLRGLLWSSIDNHDSEDLDQLEYCERQNSEIHVKIAIADVDAFVKRGDPIDRHASHNATSLYTGLESFPMLPEKLSYNLTSLLPDQDRLAIVIEYNVKKSGQIKYGAVYRAWVRNTAKLVYEDVGQWLQEPQARSYDWLTPQLQGQLRLQQEASLRLLAWRQQQGMLEFESIEPKAVIVNGRIADVVAREATQAHKIIEEFMISANETVIMFLVSRHVATIQRVVRTPERWGRIIEIAAEYGFELPLDPDPVPLRAFLVERYKKSPENFADLSLSIIKLIGRGEYEMVAPGKHSQGHFGLATGYYTHSTAPNRRYVDLIIQRLVKAVLEDKPLPYSRRDLIEQAAWSTERDSAAKKLERFMRKVAAAILLQERVGEIFDGVVTGASLKGVFVRLHRPAAEGMIVTGHEGLDVGEKVRVRLLRADPIKGFIDFQCLKVLPAGMV